jgi:ribonuclease R
MKALRSAARAMTAEELALSLEEGLSAERAAMVLAGLARSGAVAELPNGRFLALRERNVLVGRLSMNRRGFGFVRTPVGEVYVSRRDTGGALHGDTVAVRLDTKRYREGRRGEVVQVVERSLTRVVGRF